MEYRGCDPKVLNNITRIEALMRLAVKKAGANAVQSALHPFVPQGVSGVIILEESHISIHTWPEQGYAAMDFYTCGDCDPEAGLEILRQGLGADSAEIMVLDRGMSPTRSISVARHHQEFTMSQSNDVKRAPMIASTPNQGDLS